MWSFAWQNLVTRPSRTALAAVGLTIPVLAFLGLFSISQGIRKLVGGTLDTMQGVMVMRESSPSPVFSDLPADMGTALRQPDGCRACALSPPRSGRSHLRSTAGAAWAPPRSACWAGRARRG